MSKSGNHKPRKRFGQNFLHDPNVIQNIVYAIAPQDNQTLVEIGPGQGAITRRLLEHCKQLHVIEIDRDLVRHLKSQFPSTENLLIHNIDVLEFDFNTLANGKHLRLVGNLPYNISTPLLFHIFTSTRCIDDMHFMLQKEVVDRMAATPGSKRYGRLSVMTQYHCKVQPLFNVAPGAFNPPPKVQSSIVRLIPYEKKPVTLTDYNLFSQIVNQAFSLRRKTLRNALKTIINEQGLTECGLDAGKRPETVSLEGFARISNYAGQNPLAPEG